MEVILCTDQKIFPFGELTVFAKGDKDPENRQYIGKIHSLKVKFESNYNDPRINAPVDYTEFAPVFREKMRRAVASYIYQWQVSLVNSYKKASQDHDSFCDHIANRIKGNRTIANATAIYTHMQDLEEQLWEKPVYRAYVYEALARANPKVRLDGETINLTQD